MLRFRAFGDTQLRDSGHVLTLESGLGRMLGRWVHASGRYRVAVLGMALLLMSASLFVTVTQLGIRSETEALFPEDLPFRVRDDRFLKTFPMLHENIVLVVEGATAESTREGTLRLASRLSEAASLFPRVVIPADPFFEENGLLYLETEELDRLADRLARMQPLLAGLVADASLRGLMNQTRTALEGLRRNGMRANDLAPVLTRIEEVLILDDRAVMSARGELLDWAAVIDWDSSAGNPRRRVIKVQPQLDYGAMSAARDAILRIREIAADEEIDEAHGFRLGMTGDMMLNFDEMALLQDQVSKAGLLSFGVVALLLFFALRSGRLVAATVASLFFGLVMTAGFATVAIGHLNMISVAFAVLFIGLGVDFGIHLCMRFAELRRAGRAAREAMTESAQGVGSSLMLCAVTTAVGFFAFVPTDFVGVAELGVIAGVGMFIGVASSFTIIPAILQGDLRDAKSLRTLPTLRLPNWPVRHARSVAFVALVLVVLSTRLLPELRFDQNPLNVRDPAAESVRVYRDLLADGDQSPWTLEFLASSAREAREMAARFQAEPEVHRARTLDDFVPEEQAEKLAIIEDMAYFVDWDAIPRVTQAASARESIDSMAALARELEHPATDPVDTVLHAAAGSLSEVLEAKVVELREQDPASAEKNIAELDHILLGTFPDLLESLARTMRAHSIDRTSLPRAVREERVSTSGLHRVEIVPAADLAAGEALDEFVAAGQRVTADLAGPAIRIHASARAVVGALEQALASAVVVILVFLFVLWRRIGDVLLVMLPLVFAGVSTGASMVAFGIPFNFADVIVLPLLLGIGVDSGIHMVHRARIRKDRNEDLLGTSTARAVVFSAATTIASFGTLALVPHQGMANLGQLLVIGVSWTVIANLVLLPALLEIRDGRGSGA